MRTTLNIDDDLLLAVKETARREATSAGSVVSNLLRHALTHDARDRGTRDHDTREAAPAPAAVPGFRPFPRRGGIVTNELIDRLREETGDR